MKKVFMIGMLAIAFVTILSGCAKRINVESILPEYDYDRICVINARKDESLEGRIIDYAIGLTGEKDDVKLNYAIVIRNEDNSDIEIAKDVTEKEAMNKIADAFTQSYETSDAKSVLKDGTVRITFSTTNVMYGNDANALAEEYENEGATCK